MELPIFSLPDGGRLVVPRVLARTSVITRTVVAVPDGFALEPGDGEAADLASNANSALGSEQQQFWQGLLERLKLDDPEQRVPGPARQGYLNFMMPASGGTSWINVYRNRKLNAIGVETAFEFERRRGAGAYARRVIADDWATVRSELGGTAESTERDGRPLIVDRRTVPGLDKPELREQAYKWLAERVNTFENVLRPRVRSAAVDYEHHAE